MDNIKEIKPNRRFALQHLNEARKSLLADDIQAFEHHLKLSQWCVEGDQEMYRIYSHAWKMPAYWMPVHEEVSHA